jgi:hypothetical protein
MGDSAGREVLETIFSGLTLTPLERISVAEGALVWHSGQKTDGLSLSAFEDLLRRRYVQFHGEEQTLSNIESLDCGDGGIRGTLKEGGRFGSETILLGASPARSLFRTGFFPREWGVSPPGENFIASIQEGKPSPFLASRFILGGDFSIRLNFMEDSNRRSCLIECPSEEGPEGKSTQDIQSRLAPFLPFARFQLARRPSPFSEPEQVNAAVRRIRGNFPGVAAPLKLGNKVFNCNAAAVFPSLGSTGEALVGVSVANHLLGRFRKKK